MIETANQRASFGYCQRAPFWLWG